VDGSVGAFVAEGRSRATSSSGARDGDRARSSPALREVLLRTEGDLREGEASVADPCAPRGHRVEERGP
jgi:hypothetical protein